MANPARHPTNKISISRKKGKKKSKLTNILSLKCFLTAVYLQTPPPTEMCLSGPWTPSLPMSPGPIVAANLGGYLPPCTHSSCLVPAHILTGICCASEQLPSSPPHPTVSLCQHKNPCFATGGIFLNLSTDIVIRIGPWRKGREECILDSLGRW